MPRLIAPIARTRGAPLRAALLRAILPAQLLWLSPARAATVPAVAAGALARLTQAFGAPATLDTQHLAQRPLETAMLFGTAVAAATLCACFAAFLFGQRRVTCQLDATLGAMEAIGGQIMAAAAATRDAGLAIAKLSGTTLDAQAALRDWTDAAITGQDRAAALAARTARLTESLPDLLNEAVVATQARAQASIEAAAGRLDGRAGQLDAAAARVLEGAQDVTAATAGLADHQLALTVLARQCDAAVASLPDMVGQLTAQAYHRGEAAITAAATVLDARLLLLDGAAASLQAGVQELNGTASGLAAIEVDTRAAARAGNSRLQDSALCVEAAAAELQAGLVAAQAAQASQAAALAASAARVAGAIDPLPAVMASLAEAAAAIGSGGQVLAQAAADQARLAGRIEAAELPLAATSLLAAAARIEDTAEAARAETRQAAAEAVSRQEAFAVVTARADAVLAEMPQETARLAHAAAGLRHDAASLSGVAAEIGGAIAWQADRQSAWWDGADDQRARLDGLLHARCAELAGLAAGQRADQERAQAAAQQAGLAQGDSLAAATTALAAASDRLHLMMAAQSEQAGAIARAAHALPSWQAIADRQIGSLADTVAALDALLRAGAQALDTAARCQAASQADGGAALAAEVDRLARAVSAAEGAVLLIAGLLDRKTSPAAVHQAPSTPDAEHQAAGLAVQADRLDRAAAAAEGATLAACQAAEALEAQLASAAIPALRHAAAEIIAAAARLDGHASAQDQAALRVAQSARAVADAAAAPDQYAPVMRRVQSVARQAQGLLDATASLAAPGHAPPPDGLVADTPALLATIETSIRCLRGTATALALASDAARKAA